MRFRFFCLLFCLSVLSFEPVMAQDEKKEQAKAIEGVVPSTDVKLSPNDQAKQDALTKKVSGIMKGLDLAQMQHFTVIYANYMVYSLVNHVEKDVLGAVSGCTENNATMKGDLDARSQAWQTALEQPKKDSLANINSMIVAQNYLPKAEFDEIFALVDDVRAATSKLQEKQPVTTPEACKYMLSKMDDTQRNMIQLLGSTLVTYPSMLQKTQE